jgi:molecular chaperone DnaJ
VFRVREKGIPHLGGRGRGDFLVKILLVVPQKLNDQQKELLMNLSPDSYTGLASKLVELI